MYTRIFAFLLMMMLLTGFQCSAQLKAVITNLNSKETIELKPSETFYFGLLGQSEKNSGTLEMVNYNELVISGKTYKVNDITWIDKKGNKPKKNTAQIAKILFYFGGGMAAFASYEIAADNTNKQAISAAAMGVGLMFSALCVRYIPRQPLYDFSTKYYLETINTSSNSN